MDRTPPPRKGPVEEAQLKPCAQCPWRTENHGKRHPGGWYTKANRQRLWARLRRGDSMTCHPTDPTNPVPEGMAPAPEHATTHECAGALILQQRELMYLQSAPDLKSYRRSRPSGLTVEGIQELISRALFGGVPMIGGRKMAEPDLNEPVSHDALGPWAASEIKVPSS